MTTVAQPLITIPIVPLRRGVFFPHSLGPVSAGPKASRAIAEALGHGAGPIGVVPMVQPEAEAVTLESLAKIGTLARVEKVLKTPNDEVALVVQGTGRFRVVEVESTEPYVQARVELVEDRDDDPLRTAALALTVKQVTAEAIKSSKDLPDQLADLLGGLTDASQLADLIAGHLDATPGQKIPLLEELHVAARLEGLLTLIEHRRQVVALSNEIDGRVEKEMNNQRREHLLRQQLKAIRQELGDHEGEGEEEGDDDPLAALSRRLDEAHLPEEAQKTAQRELRRLRSMSESSGESSVVRTYLEWLADLPWDKKSEVRLELSEVRALLEARHFGLEQVKKRILEFLAVRRLKQDLQSPILCLVGPPGVGKTSLAQSVAEALGRKLHRISLGGVRDEAEIRGHRRTYVGAQPGRIIQGLRRAGVRDPVFVLDEVDKLASDFRGDPSSALLEVLDPEQNARFSDHYLELPFDLSKVLFIATANELSPIPPALLDRMEVIEIPSYTQQEKLHIARRHLMPKVLEAHGLKADQLELADGTLDEIVSGYTREAGVRNLERQLAAVIRALAVEVAEKGGGKLTVSPADLEQLLGPKKFEREIAQRTLVPGVAVGLAWTSVGGEILFVEAARMPGKGRFTVTGQLGEVMKESLQAAQSYLRSHSLELGIPESVWGKEDLHVHLPAGATPKDGPSAGVTMVAALASLLLGTKVRSDVAMSGEITLRGQVLPVGGIKEKVLAAARAGIAEVVLPARNAKDLWDVPDEVKQRLKISFVQRIDELLDRVLERPPVRVVPPILSGPLGSGLASGPLPQA